MGDVFVIAGQSNAVMMAQTHNTSLQPSTALPLQRNVPGLFKWTADPIHADLIPTGSAWPLLADRVVGQTGIPMMFIPTALGSTALVSPSDWAVGGDLWQRMLDRIRLGTTDQMCVRAVLWFQGESDALHGVSKQAYRAALEEFGRELQAQLSCPTPLVVARIGAFDAVPEVDLEAIRDAQTEAAAEHPVILPGPITADLPTWDGVHFGDAAMPELAERWCLALGAFYELDCTP